MAQRTKVYQKQNRLKPGKILLESLGDIVKSRYLARQLAVRDIKSQYRQSYLGLLWALITPLATALVWVFLNKSGTIRLTDTGIPYPLFAFSGALLWSILVESINAPTKETNSARSILTKINFPKEALLVSGIYKLLFNSVIKLVLLLVFVFVFMGKLEWTVLLFPLALIAGIFFGTTIGLVLTPIGLLYTDIGKLVSFALRFLLYAAPVVYAVPKSGIFKTLMEWNPFTPILTTMRELIVGIPVQYDGYFLIILAICIPVFFIALIFYRVSVPIIVERLSA